MQAPDPNKVIDFLSSGGVFALLCVIVIGGGFAAFFFGRALFSLLREFLTKTTSLLETQTSETKMLRVHMEATSEVVNPWGNPEWLQKRLDVLDHRAEAIQKEVAALRLQVANIRGGQG